MTQAQWVYGFRVQEEEDGAFHAYSAAAPEAIISGATRSEAVAAMREGIAAAVRGRMKLGLDLAPPAAPAPDEDEACVLPAPLAAKATIYAAWRASGLTKVALAERLGCHEKEVRRILDPDHGTGIDRLYEAGRAIGVELLVASQPMAA